MIRKLQRGHDAAARAPRPEATRCSARSSRRSKARIDEAAAANAQPGPAHVPAAEPRRSTSARSATCSALDVDAGDWLPLDTKSANFDNIADVQALSPTLLEAYLNAAGDISRMAVGDRQAARVDVTYTNPSYVSQHPWDHVEGAPYGTRGGMVVNHVFPADGEYEFELLRHLGRQRARSRTSTSRSTASASRCSSSRPRRRPPPTAAAASRSAPSRSSCAPASTRCRRRSSSAPTGPYEDLIRRTTGRYAGGGSGGAGITTLPHLRDLVVAGPYNATGVSETPSRQKIFTCRPTSPTEERPCARTILTRLAGEAYRRPLTAAEVDGLMPFYEQGADERRLRGRRAHGARGDPGQPALRLPPRARAARTPRPGRDYRVADVDLASRLSFFLWGTPPDEELLTLAERAASCRRAGRSSSRRGACSPTRAPRRSGTRFAAQWLRLQDLDKVHPDPNFFPNFDEQPRRRDAAARPSCSSTTWCARTGACSSCTRADYTFVNERLARHYGIPERRRHRVPPRAAIRTTRGAASSARAAILVQTSLANRTSPVLRGKWVMEVLLGTPPPPPPPDVPALEETGEAEGRQAADDARADGDAPGEPDLQLLPPVHGSDRPGARQLRRDRQVAHPRERHAARHARRALRRHAGQRRRPS